MDLRGSRTVTSRSTPDWAGDFDQALSAAPSWRGRSSTCVSRQGGRPRAHRRDRAVVEDEAVVRGVILEMLGEQGYRTLEAVDGPSGLRSLRAHERIDLLVTDIVCPASTAANSPTRHGKPGRSQDSFHHRLRRERRDGRLLFAAGYGNDAPSRSISAISRCGFARWFRTSVSFLFEHDLRANATRLSARENGLHFSGSCARV